MTLLGFWTDGFKSIFAFFGRFWTTWSSLILGGRPRLPGFLSGLWVLTAFLIGFSLTRVSLQRLKTASEKIFLEKFFRILLEYICIMKKIFAGQNSISKFWAGLCESSEELSESDLSLDCFRAFSSRIDFDRWLIGGGASISESSVSWFEMTGSDFFETFVFGFFAGRPRLPVFTGLLNFWPVEFRRFFGLSGRAGFMAWARSSRASSRVWPGLTFTNWGRVAEQPGINSQAPGLSGPGSFSDELESDSSEKDSKGWELFATFGVFSTLAVLSTFLVFEDFFKRPRRSARASNSSSKSTLGSPDSARRRPTFWKKFQITQNIF